MATEVEYIIHDRVAQGLVQGFKVIQADDQRGKRWIGSLGAIQCKATLDALRPWVGLPKLYVRLRTRVSSKVPGQKRQSRFPVENQLLTLYIGTDRVLLPSDQF